MSDKVASPRSTTAYEWLARVLVAGILLGLLAFILLARWQSQTGWVELHGVMSESGGWTPGDLTATVGEPLHLRLISDDVMHGFAVGQKDWPAIDMQPGKPVETDFGIRPARQIHLLLHPLVRAEPLAHARRNRGRGRSQPSYSTAGAAAVCDAGH